MVRVKAISKPYTVESQFSDDTVEMVNVTLEGSTSGSQMNQGAALLGRKKGIVNLGLGGGLTCTIAVREEHADQFTEGEVIDDLYINRVWCSENPYPKAVDDQGRPLAEPIPDVMCPDGQKRDLYSRTILSEKQEEVKYDIIEDEVEAPPVDAKRGQRKVREAR